MSDLEDPNAEFEGPYIGRSDSSFAEAARNANDDLFDKHKRYPNPPKTFRADCYVKIGNPIHEFIVELTPGP